MTATLTRPRYRAEDFQDTEFHTAAEKARFTNELLAFIDAGYPESRFTSFLYKGLHIYAALSFIAWYDKHGFYAEELATPDRQQRFLSTLWNDCARGAHSNRIDLWSDVKAALEAELTRRDSDRLF